MLEKNIELKLRKAVEKLAGKCLKFTAPGFDGVPDRMVILPNGKIGFVEVKQKGMKLRRLQKRRAKQLRELGFVALVLDDPNDIKGVIDEIQST